MASKVYSTALFFCCIASTAAAAVNITFAVPEGTSNHGDPNLICTPTHWTDIATFFLGNYVAHVATVPTFHGEPNALFKNAVFALFFPGWGLNRGMIFIFSFATFGKDVLEKALRAQALFMVVRSGAWRPIAGEVVRDLVIRGPNKTREAKLSGKGIHVCVYDPPWMTSLFGIGWPSSKSTSELHGRPDPPLGYKIIPVPRGAIIDPLDEREATCTICCHNNIAKSLIALGQVLYASTTLYRATGNQVAQYGYAAFGLTVTLYAAMSVVNLTAALFCPTFPETYLVESSVLREARACGGKFHGIVGRLVEEDFKLKVTESETSPGVFVPDQPIHFYQRPNLSETLQVDRGSVLPTRRKAASETLEREVSPLVQSSNAAEDELSSTIEATAPRPTLLLFEPVAEFSDNTEELIMLVPAFSPFKLRRSNVYKEGIVQKASWNYEKARWDVKFAGKVRERELIYLFRAIFILLLGTFINGIPFVVIGCISKYQKGLSTLAQRTWIMGWLCFGQGYVLGTFLIGFLTRQFGHYLPAPWLHLLRLTLEVGLMVPAIGGLVVVGQMLKAYGSCTLLA